ncbi:MAG: capsular biosynthesis protein [Hyphomicrobiales bacterium]|nr:capsular biosynthesis protein [Hyphomicrobiales bacterium]
MASSAMGNLTAERASGRRSFLFLQGPLSPLYARLADECEAQGHRVARVNFNVGDRLHWNRKGAVAFKGRIAEWPRFATNLMERDSVTDIIMHGERRLYHRIAAAIARAHGARVIVTELGYLRPDWMTIELNGTGAASHFPNDPAAIRLIAANAPEIDFAPRYRTQFWRVAAPDVAYNLLNTALWWLYPNYRRHTIYYPPLEYAAWCWRLTGERSRNKAAAIEIERLRATKGPLFVFALQLEGDFQIRHRSPFSSFSEAIETVLASFKAHAPMNATLAIKAHPLDNGLDRWRRYLTDAVRRLNLQSRVVFFDGGALGDVLAGAAGLVTVNSSAGIEALQRGCPVKTLAPAIYDVDGITHQGPLDSFWTAPAAPDPKLVGAFVKALAASVQARGTIYSREGLDEAAQNISQRILQMSRNAPDAYADPAPRREALRRMIRERCKR